MGLTGTGTTVAPRWDGFIDTIDPNVALEECDAMFEELDKQLDDLTRADEKAALTLALKP